MRLDGTDVQQHVRVTGWVSRRQGSAPPPQQPNELLMSPDGEHAIAMVTNNVYYFPVPMAGGTTPTISIINPATATVPVRRLTRIGGDFIGWASDGKSLYYSLGHSFFTYDLAAAEATPDSACAARGVRAARVDVDITVPRDKPSGTVALVGARIVTMKGNEVIERGTSSFATTASSPSARGKRHGSRRTPADRRRGQDDHAGLGRHPRAHVAARAACTARRCGRIR